MAINRTGTAVTINASQSKTGTSSSFTVPANCNAIIAMWHFWENNENVGMTSLELNGSTFIIVENAGDISDTNGVGIAVLATPSTGSQTLDWVWASASPKAFGGGIVLTFVTDANVADLVRDFGVDRQTSSNDVSVVVTSVATDLVLSSCSSDGTPGLSGTVYVDNYAVEGENHDYAEQTALAGTTTSTMTGENYSSMASIALKNSGTPPATVDTTLFYQTLMAGN